MPPITKFVYAV